MKRINDVPASVGALVVKMAQHALKDGAESFLLEWTNPDSKTPRGFKINGVEISYAQHGVIIGVNGKQIGTYDRLTEFGGPDRDQHAMFIVPSHGPWCNWLPNKDGSE